MSNNAKRNEISEMLCGRPSVNGIVNSFEVHHATVFQVKKIMKEGKSIKCTKPTEKKCASRTEDASKAISKSSKEDPAKSMCSLVSATVSKIVKEARGKSETIIKRPLLLENTWAI